MFTELTCDKSFIEIGCLQSNDKNTSNSKLLLVQIEIASHIKSAALPLSQL
jgi:hypothetical protein